MKKNYLFETKTCGRCGGTGNYSYCQMYGTRCFGCGGNGVQHTKRGAAAQAWLNAKRRKPAQAVQIGDKIVIQGLPGAPAQVATVTFVGKRGHVCRNVIAGTTHEYLEIDAVTAKGEKTGVWTFEDHDVQMFVAGEALVALKQEALAYQATLTQAGTVKKRAAKAA